MAILFNGKLLFESREDTFSIEYVESVKYPNFVSSKSTEISLTDEQVEELYKALTAHRKAARKRVKE